MVAASHPHRLALGPPPPGPRPQWSVVIPTYHCAETLRTTLQSVLNQDPGPDVMEIEVVDDHSTADDPAAVVADLGRGRVGFFRQPLNVGSNRNFATGLARARGHLVHLLHGDDSVRDGFYARLADGMAQAPAAGAAVCRHLYADADGHWQSVSPLDRPTPGLIEGWLPKIASGQRLATPAVVVRRSTYERLGLFDARLRTSEDWEMWVRIAAHYPVWFEPEPLAVYRMQRPGALSHAASGEARFVRDMRRATDAIAEYLPLHLPPDEAARALARARRTYAGWGLEGARAGAWSGSVRQALAHGREALACERSPRVAVPVGLTLAHAAYRRGRHLVVSRLPRALRERLRPSAHA